MPAPAPPPPVRTTTLKTFLKERTGLRVGDATVEGFAAHLTERLERAAARAAAYAAAESRSTVLPRDLERALDEDTRDASAPGALVEAIEALDNEALSRLIQLLTARARSSSGPG